MGKIDKDIRDIILAINMNTRIHLQTVTTISYKKKAKTLTTKYGIEYLKRAKYVDEETGKNKYHYVVVKFELLPNKVSLYKRLGEIYQEKMSLKGK